jgi:ferredoxin-NADP reductase
MTVSSSLDRLLGRVTMYGLVIICLVVLAAVSLVLMTFGQLAYSPLALLTSASVLLLVSFVSNNLIGVILRTRPQLSSTVITALLLLFILPPSTTAAGLGVLALAAFLAVLSKYLLAFRKRHIFNPAAMGAFLVGLTGLGFSAWWVATPPLLPFVAVAGFLVLWRTRRIPLALVFIVVATLNIAARTALGGFGFVDGISTALLSLPVVFFACFMLDEPLTLPPRRWQQLAEAAVVGVLFYLQFSLGTFGSTPEFALLIGNLLAFFAGQRRGIRLDFLGRRELTPTSWQFDFRAQAPVRFLAGQYMELTLPHDHSDRRGWRRVFTIAAAPGDGRGIRFAMRVPDDASSFKKALLRLEPGAVVSATAVHGDFVLPVDVEKPLLLVAAGIGITPFVSHLEHLTHLGAAGAQRDLVLLYAVNRADDVAFVEVLRASGARVVVVAPECPAGLPTSWTWVEGTASTLSAEGIRAAVPDAAARTSYLSGAPDLVAGLERALRRDGVKRVVTDVFVGY